MGERNEEVPPGKIPNSRSPGHAPLLSCFFGHGFQPDECPRLGHRRELYPLFGARNSGDEHPFLLNIRRPFGLMGQRVWFFERDHGCACQPGLPRPGKDCRRGDDNADSSCDHSFHLFSCRLQDYHRPLVSSGHCFHGFDCGDVHRPGLDFCFEDEGHAGLQHRHELCHLSPFLFIWCSLSSGKLSPLAEIHFPPGPPYLWCGRLERGFDRRLFAFSPFRLYHHDFLFFGDDRAGCLFF